MSVRFVAMRVQDVQRRIELDENIWRRTVPEAVMQAASMLVPAYVEMHVPKRSGELQKSAEIKITPTSLTLTFESPYAQYVNEGTAPSSGRYVPAIGKKLKAPSRTNPNIGMHPGIKPTNFIEAIANDMKEDMGGIIEAIARREWIR